MSEQFSDYRYLIEQLAPKANDSNFGARLRDHTKGFSTETRFLLKMEMKRLAKPCIRSIDLRILVTNECQLIDYQGVQHYLDENGKLLFEDLVSLYGDYTFGVYETVMDRASNDEPFSDDIPITLDGEEDKPNWEKYITPYDELMFYHHRRDERMNFVVNVDLLLSSTQSITATSVDISLRGLKLKLDDHQDLPLIKGFRPIQVIFSGFNHSSGVSKEAIEYRVVRITGDGKQARIHLARDWQVGPKAFNEYLAKLIKANKRRYKVNLDNTVKAVESKIFEQAFASNCPSLSIFINSDDPIHPFAEYACVNSYNAPILDYWLDENDQQNIGYLVNKERLIALSTDNSSNATMIIYAFNHVSNGKTYFYSASEQDLNESPELKDVFLSYASRKVSWRVYKLSINDLSPKQAYLPSSIPNGVNRDIDRINRPLTPRLLSKLQHLSHLVTVNDITHSIGQQCYQKRELVHEKIKQLANFGHARNKPPKSVQSFRYTQKDKRKETRYQLRTDVIVHDDYNIKGISEDVSVSGLRLELEEPIDARINTKLSVSFTDLQSKTQDYDLTHLRYRVKHISVDGHVLHLEAISEDELSVAEQFFAQLIDNNKDKLHMLSNEESVPGMGLALRSLQSKVTPQTCVYMQRKPGGYVPIKATVSNTRSTAMAFMRHQMPLTSLNFSWLFQDRTTSNAFVRKALKTLKFDANAIEQEVFIAFNSGEIDPEKSTIAQWETEIATHRQKYRFIKNAILEAQFLAFRVTVNHVIRPDIALLEHEQQYLSQYAIHKAKELEEMMWNISGQLYITDISDEVRIRYGLDKLSN